MATELSGIKSIGLKKIKIGIKKKNVTWFIILLDSISELSP